MLWLVVLFLVILYFGLLRHEYAFIYVQHIIAENYRTNDAQTG